MSDNKVSKRKAENSMLQSRTPNFVQLSNTTLTKPNLTTMPAATLAVTVLDTACRIVLLSHQRNQQHVREKSQQRIQKNF